MKKFVNIVCLSACMLVLLSGHAFAYLDPSVMTYTIQIIAGVVVAVGAVVGILWRRAKKKVQNKLGIDENAKKEMEEDVVEYEDDAWVFYKRIVFLRLNRIENADTIILPNGNEIGIHNLRSNWFTQSIKSK